MLADFLAYVWPALPMFFFAGLCFVLAGGIWLVAIRRHELAMGPTPRKLAAPPAADLPRRDSDTGVVPRIPGATPQAGPVCPVCGGPFHPVCPSRERNEETVVLPPVAALAPQLVALSRFFKAVDEAREDTDKAMHRIVDDLAGRDDDCPLTTQEIEVTETAPLYVASGGTVDLSEKLKKVNAP